MKMKLLQLMCVLFYFCLLPIFAENLAADCKKKDINDHFKDEIPDLNKNRAQLKWSRVVTTLEELKNAFTEDSHMIKANVVHNTDKIACIEPRNPDEDPTLKLEDFLKEYKREDGKLLQGLMLHLKTQEGYDSAIVIFEKMTEKVTKFPLWLHMNVAQGPAGNENIVDPKYTYNPILDCFTTSLGLTTGLDPVLLYTEEMIKNMTSVMSKKNDFYAFRGVYLKKSWDAIHEVLLKANEIIVWVEDEDVAQIEKLSLRNMLYTRRRYTFTDIPEGLQTDMDEICQKNQDMYDFFKGKVSLENGFDNIKWHKSVQSLKELTEALEKSEYHMIKADVIAINGIAVIESKSFTLEKLFDEMSKSKDKGVKLHFLTTEAFDVTVKNHADLIKTLEYPVWIEANILQGPGGSSELVDLKYEASKEFLSCHQVSLGWTSTSKDPNREYTREMIEEMRDTLKRIPDGPSVVYSLRAMYVYKAESPIDGKLHDLNSNFYFWASEEDDERIISNDLRYIRDLFEGFFYFDIPDGMYPRLDKCPKNRNVARFFKITELSENLRLLTFSEYVDDEVAFNNFLQGEEHMIKATVSLKKENGADVAVVGEIVSWPLEQLFAEIDKPTWIKGLVLRFKSAEAFKFTLKEFHRELRKMERPIWLYVDVAKGPGGTDEGIINTDYLLYNDAMDCCTMVYGWTTNINEDKFYKEEDAMAMEQVEKGRGSTVYALRAEYASSQSLINMKPISNRGDYYVFLPKQTQDTFVSKDLRLTLMQGRKNLYVDVEEDYLLECPINQDVHEYFEIGALNLTKLVFSKKAIETPDDFNQLLEDDSIHMIKANVITNATGVSMVTETLKLVELLQELDESNKAKGIELTFNSSEAVQDSMKVALSTFKKMQRPIWFRANILKGPGNSPEATVDMDHKHFNDALDCRDLVLGWTTNVHQQTETTYTQQQVTAMSEYPIAGKRIIYEIRGEYLGKSWEMLSQTLPPDDNLFKVWIPNDDQDRTVVIAKELRDVAIKYFYALYVDIPQDVMYMIRPCSDSQDVNSYFYNKDLKRNATALEFHDVIRTLGQLESAMMSGKDMINIEVFDYDGEAVVEKVSGEGDAGVASLEEFLIAIDGKDGLKMGIQLLFQTTSAFIAAMKNHYELLRNMNRPIWINANVVKGPGGDDNLINIDYEKYNDLLDCRNMILGWTTDSSGRVYTQEHIEEMKRIPLGDSPKIYSIRLLNLLDSWENFKSLKDKQLLLWSADGDKDSLESEELKKIISGNEEKLYLDFSDDVRRYINGACNKTLSVMLGFVIFVLHVITLTVNK